MSYGPFSTESFLFFWDASTSGYLADDHHQCTPCDLPKYHMALSIDGNFSYLIFDNNHKPIIREIQTTPQNPHEDLTSIAFRSFLSINHSNNHIGITSDDRLGIINDSFLSTMPMKSPVKISTEFKELSKSRKRLREELGWSTINPRMYKQTQIALWEPKKYPLWFPHLFNLLIRIPFPPRVYSVKNLNQRAMLHTLNQIKVSDLCYSHDNSVLAALDTLSTNIVPVLKVLIRGLESDDPLYSSLTTIDLKLKDSFVYPEVYRVLKQCAARRTRPHFKQETLVGTCLWPKAEIKALLWHDFCMEYLNKNKRGISILKEDAARDLAHMDETLDRKISQKQKELVLMNTTRNYRISPQRPHQHSVRAYYRYVSSRRVFLQQLLSRGHLFKEQETVELLYRGISLPEPPMKHTLEPYIAQADRTVFDYSGVIWKHPTKRTLKEREYASEYHRRRETIQYGPPFICWLFIWGNGSEPAKISLCLNDDFAYKPKELYLNHPVLTSAIEDIKRQLFLPIPVVTLNDVKQGPSYSAELQALPNYNYISSTTDSLPHHSWHLIEDIILMNGLPGTIIRFEHKFERYMLVRSECHRCFLDFILKSRLGRKSQPRKIETTPKRVLDYIEPIIVIDYNDYLIQQGSHKMLESIPDTQDQITIILQKLSDIYSEPNRKAYLCGKVVSQEDFIAHLHSTQPLSFHAYHYPWWTKLGALPSTTPLTDMISTYPKKMDSLPVNDEVLKFYQRAAWEDSWSINDPPLNDDNI